MLAYIYIFLSKNTSSTSGPAPGSFQVEEVRSWAPPGKRPAAGTDLNPISDIPTYIFFWKEDTKNVLLCSSMATSRGCWCLCISVEASASCRKMIRFHQNPPTKKNKDFYALQGLLLHVGILILVRFVYQGLLQETEKDLKQKNLFLSTSWSFFSIFLYPLLSSFFSPAVSTGWISKEASCR